MCDGLYRNQPAAVAINISSALGERRLGEPTWGKISDYHREGKWSDDKLAFSFAFNRTKLITIELRLKFVPNTKSQCKSVIKGNENEDA